MYTEQQFNIPKLQGISEKTIEEHLKLYAGYVKHVNLINDHIAELSKDSEKFAYELGELQRRFGFEWGGMRNHECYFSTLEEGHKDLDADSTLAQAITAQWGSFDTWLERFKAIALTRGIGWAMLYWDPSSKKIVNAWVDEQHLGQLAGCQLILALDMWEHSYVADYLPSGKKQYVQDYISNINWEKVQKNFETASQNL